MNSVIIYLFLLQSLLLHRGVNGWYDWDWDDLCLEYEPWGGWSSCSTSVCQQTGSRTRTLTYRYMILMEIVFVNSK